MGLSITHQRPILGYPHFWKPQFLEGSGRGRRPASQSDLAQVRLKDPDIGGPEIQDGVHKWASTSGVSIWLIMIHDG